MEQTPRAFFQMTFEPIGRVCAARHARGGLGLQGKWGTRACVPHTPYIRATACCLPCRPLNPNSHPSSLPWERVRERVTSRKACLLGDSGIWERLPQFVECPLPNPPPRGREEVAADSSVAGRLKKECLKYQQQEFFR